MLTRCDNYRLIIASRPKDCERYWTAILEDTRGQIQEGRILLRADFIPDEETEVYFKAADIAVLPYRHIYQSGVLFLAHSFGLPVIAAAVGSLKDEIVEGTTGFLFTPEDPADLAKAIERYFASDLYANLHNRRQEIRDYATERHSWDVAGEVTLMCRAAVRKNRSCNLWYRFSFLRTRRRNLSLIRCGQRWPKLGAKGIT